MSRYFLHLVSSLCLNNYVALEQNKGHFSVSYLHGEIDCISSVICCGTLIKNHKNIFILYIYITSLITCRHQKAGLINFFI